MASEYVDAVTQGTIPESFQVRRCMEDDGFVRLEISLFTSVA